MQATEERDGVLKAYREFAARWPPGSVLDDGRHGASLIAASIDEATHATLLTFRRWRGEFAWTEEASALMKPSFDWFCPATRAAEVWAGLGEIPRRGEVYRHYKGGLYSIVATSLRVPILRPLVTYISNADGTCWTRTLEDFTSYVWLHDVPHPIPRFKREHD